MKLPELHARAGGQHSVSNRSVADVYPCPISVSRAARTFLNTLAGDEPVTFQTFSDKDELKVKRGSGKLYDPNARILHGRLEEHVDALIDLNRRGAGVHVMVNAGDLRGRAARSVFRVRAVFIDTDGVPYPAPLPLKPHLVVQSSSGRWHLYWLLSGLELSDFGVLQEALAERYGTDPSIKDLPRVMRLPGFFHRKAEPVMVELLEAHDHAPYSPTDIFTAWPFLPERLEVEKRIEAEKAAQRAAILARAAERKANPTVGTSDQARAMALLQGHHDTVAAAWDGTRHLTLQRSARALGGYVAGGVIEAHEVIEVLTAAANVCGLPEGEAADAIRWGLRKGAEDPLELRESSGPKITSTRDPRRPKSRSSRIHFRMRGWAHGRA